MGSDLAIRLFGPIEVRIDGRTLGPRDLGGARPKQVLEILLAARGHRVSTDRLAELIWAEALPRNAAGSLQTFVSVLRRHLVADRELARDLVVTESEAYRVAADLVDLDLDRFDELVDRAAHEPTRAARRSLESALALVRGDVLEDEPYAVWAQDLRRTYQGRVLGARLDAADAALAELDYGVALSHAQAAEALDAFAERAHRTEMLALYALDRQHDALDTYRRFRERLAGELGLEPTAATRALESAILRQDDVRELLPRPTGRAELGGGQRTSIRLLGRAAERAALDEAVTRALCGEGTLLLLEGDSGLGKTRLLDELAAGLDDAHVGRARCSQLEGHLPYVPLAAAVRDALGGVEWEHSSALRRILPELGSEPSVHAVDELDALEALVDLLTRCAPVALLLDDVHWADASTIAALSYLQHRLATARVVLVASVHSGQSPLDDPVRRLQPDTRVRLEPLTPTDLAPLGMPGLHEATGGNPRFVADAVERGSGSGLSDDLAEALVAQCRAEGPWGYRVLVAASVLAQPFAPEQLAALLHADVSELVEELERLSERRILRVDGPRFGFRYRLVQDVLLASLSPARRGLLLRGLEEHDAPDRPVPVFPVASDGRAAGPIGAR
jgi:DNA-binding SARP family transcriptional activator